MEEFRIYVTCPHCEEEQSEHFAFNFMEADECGCDSQLHEFTCDNYEAGCGKKFWAKGHVSFETSADYTYKTKPKTK